MLTLNASIELHLTSNAQNRFYAIIVFVSFILWIKDIDIDFGPIPHVFISTDRGIHYFRMECTSVGVYVMIFNSTKSCLSNP